MLVCSIIFNIRSCKNKGEEQYDHKKTDIDESETDKSSTIWSNKDEDHRDSDDQSVNIIASPDGDYIDETNLWNRCFTMSYKFQVCYL